MNDLFLYLMLAVYLAGAALLVLWFVRKFADWLRLTRSMENDRKRGYSLSNHYRSRPGYMKGGRK